MTQLLRLLNQIFALHGTNRNLIKFNICHKPNINQQIVQLLFSPQCQYAVIRRK